MYNKGRSAHNGVLFNVAETLIDPAVVLVWFVSQLTMSSLLVGLVVPLNDAGWFLPQMFVSGYVERRRRKLPVYAATAVVRLAAWSALAQRRGSFFALRQLLGRLLGLGAALGTVTGAALLTDLVWGWMSDRFGNRLVMRTASLVGALMTLWALVTVLVAPFISLSPYLMLPVFALMGFQRPAGMLTGSNFLLEIAPADDRPLYLGFANTLMGLTLLVAGLGGLVVDLLGFAGVFGLGLALYLVSFWLATWLEEPRRLRIGDCGMRIDNRQGGWTWMQRNSSEGQEPLRCE